jgi:hypothetical protein
LIAQDKGRPTSPPLLRSFLERRLKEPDFKLIKPVAAEFTNAEKQLTGNEYNKHKKEKCSAA